MADDIVNKLRMQADVADAFPMLRAKDSAMTNWVREAADEIERLRRLVHRWETCELVAESLCDIDNPESFCDNCKEPF